MCKRWPVAPSLPPGFTDCEEHQRLYRNWGSAYATVLSSENVKLSLCFGCPAAMLSYSGFVFSFTWLHIQWFISLIVLCAWHSRNNGSSLSWRWTCSNNHMWRHLTGTRFHKLQSRFSRLRNVAAPPGMTYYNVVEISDFCDEILSIWRGKISQLQEFWMSILGFFNKLNWCAVEIVIVIVQEHAQSCALPVWEIKGTKYSSHTFQCLLRFVTPSR